MMNEKKLRKQMEELNDGVPEVFHRAVNSTLARIDQDERTPAAHHGLGMRRAAAIVLAAALLLGTVAVAADYWGIYDRLGFMLGDVSQGEGAAVQQMLHQETVNGVEITVREAMYDGRTLFLQYSYRILDEKEPFGLLKEGRPVEGISDEALQKLEDKNVGWWIDAFWIDGKRMDMAGGSGSTYSGTEVPGEIVHTEYWRLDAIDVELEGVVEIALPIGEQQPLSEYTRKDHPEKYGEDGELMKPDKGLVTFTFDAGAAKESVLTVHPQQKTVTPEVTAWVEEAAFSPMMTYITLALEGNEEALQAFKAENGEGHMDENGELLWPFEALDVHGTYLSSLTLVDGEGKEVFPGVWGCEGMGSAWAEFIYPHMETIPEELWLAPRADNGADMSLAIRVK